MRPFQIFRSAALILWVFALPGMPISVCFRESQQTATQCLWGGSGARPQNGITCSGDASLEDNPNWTQAFIDNTNDETGGCSYSWAIKPSAQRRPGRQYRLCFRENQAYAECQLNLSSCTSWTGGGDFTAWTGLFRDDSDSRTGFCEYQWRIEGRQAPVVVQSAPTDCAICFSEQEGSSQCGGNRSSCSAPSNGSLIWTGIFRDSTDGGSGGCMYEWRLKCKTACPNGTVFSSGSSVCTACPAGTQSLNATVCAKCDPGWFNPTAGKTCQKCPSGTVAPVGSTKCYGCISGSFAYENSAECQVCPEGSVSGSNASSCTMCGDGYFPSNTSSCAPCPVGSISVSGDANCTSCEAGSFPLNASTCSPCPSGAVSNIGDTNCTLCGAGMVPLLPSTCTKCPNGTISQIGDANCTVCGDGFFPSSPSSCSICPDGSISVSGDVNCTACGAGYFPSSASTCSLCPSGAVSNIGDKNCTLCGAGMAPVSASTCAQCPDGTISQTGDANCSLCAAGFSPSSPSSCSRCPSGSISKAGDANCTECPAGEFTSTIETCSPCPSGSVSGVGAVNCTACGVNSYVSSPSTCSDCPNGTYSWESSIACSNCSEADEASCSSLSERCSWCGSFCRAIGHCPACHQLNTLTECKQSPWNCDSCLSSNSSCETNETCVICEERGKCPDCSAFNSESSCLSSIIACHWCNDICQVDKCKSESGSSSVGVTAGGAVGGAVGVMFIFTAIYVSKKKLDSRRALRDSEFSRSVHDAASLEQSDVILSEIRTDVLPRDDSEITLNRSAAALPIDSQSIAEPYHHPRDSFRLSVSNHEQQSPPPYADNGPRHVYLSAQPDVNLECELNKLEGKQLKDLQRIFPQYSQMHHEDYTERRIKAGKKPLIFLITEAWEVSNPTLERWYQMRRTYMKENLGRSEEEMEERVAFHGSHAERIDSICKNGLLRVGHPLNPSDSTDEGFFGDPHCGVYASRFFEYTLQYSNATMCSNGRFSVLPLEEGESAKIIMLKVLPGKIKHMSMLAGAVQPTEGYDSNASPSWSEWFFYDETQTCPTHIINVKAITNLRTGANDGL